MLLYFLFESQISCLKFRVPNSSRHCLPLGMGKNHDHATFEPILHSIQMWKTIHFYVKKKPAKLKSDHFMKKMSSWKHKQGSCDNMKGFSRWSPYLSVTWNLSFSNSSLFQTWKKKSDFVMKFILILVWTWYFCLKGSSLE